MTVQQKINSKNIKITKLHQPHKHFFVNFASFLKIIINSINIREIKYFPPHIIL